jgi:hypothetical protein
MLLAIQEARDLSPTTPILGGLAFIAFWILINFLLSRMGWHAFAKRYPAPQRPRGTVYSSPFTHFGLLLARYSFVVRIVASDSGVYFSTSLLFRAFHPPFLVPWTSVKKIERHGILGNLYRLDIEDDSGKIHVTLPTRGGHELLHYMKGPVS